MAVCCRIYGKEEVEYVGATLSTYERNGYDDSDFYAICWDEEKNALVDVEYDTTRCGGGGWAKVDATKDVLRKAFRHCVNNARNHFDSVYNEAQAKKVKVGDTVVVMRGRKVPIGTTATCFWVGSRKNYYTYRDEERAGIEFGGQRVFLPLEYVEVEGWEERLIRGKERKRLIRKAAVREMPIVYRQMFEEVYFQGRYGCYLR